MIRPTAAAILALGLSALPASAADIEGTLPAITTLTTLEVTAPTRPVALPILYFSLAGLQAYDIYSTGAALARGAVEVNPLMAGVAGGPVGFAVAKAASTAGIIFITERLWRKNRVAAILTMLIANGVMATVAMNNARVLRQLQ